MSRGRHIDWKLIFHFDETYPNQEFTCVVEPTHPFKGFFLVFSNPEAFYVKGLSVGVVNQLVAGHHMPAVALQKQTLILPVCVPGMRITLEVLNVEKLDAGRLVKGTRKVKTHYVATPFHAELHGKILLGSEDDTPVPTTFEGPVVDDNKVN